MHHAQAESLSEITNTCPGCHLSASVSGAVGVIPIYRDEDGNQTDGRSGNPLAHEILTCLGRKMEDRFIRRRRNLIIIYCPYM
jgi:hypothetical protein